MKRIGIALYVGVLYSLFLPKFALIDAQKPTVASLDKGIIFVGAKFEPLKKAGEAVPSGVPVMAAPGNRADLDIGKGTILLSLRGNLPSQTASPALESIVTLDEPKNHEDLDLTLQRGRIVIESVKGQAKVLVHVENDLLTIDLSDKGSAVAVELSNHWPEGARFVKDSPKDRRPIGNLILMATKGKANVDFGGRKYELTAPMFCQWTTLYQAEGPLPLKELPSWTLPNWNPVMKAAPDKSMMTQDDYYVLLATSSPAEYIGLLQSRVTTAKERQLAVAPLRALINRGVKDEQALYKTLLDAEFKAAEAETFIELLHGFSAQDRIRPETYDTLITYLGANRQEVRELAIWNLEKLVPEGASIHFDAAASPTDRATAQAAWRKLIPEGKLPMGK